MSRRFGAAPDRVFDAWIDPAVAGRWLFATASRPATRVDIDARAAGTFRFVDGRDGDPIEHAGFYVEVDRPRRLAFTLTASNHREVTRVNIEIVPRGTGCELTLVHEKVPADSARYAEGRWTGMLYGLDQTLGG